MQKSNKFYAILLCSLFLFSCNNIQSKKSNEVTNITQDNKQKPTQVKTYNFNTIQLTQKDNDTGYSTRTSRTIKVEYYDKSISLKVYDDNNKMLMELKGDLYKKDVSSYGNCDMYKYNDTSITICTGLPMETSSNGIGIFIINNGVMTEFVNL